MNTDVLRRIALLAVTVCVAGCTADGGPADIASASLGEANRQTMLAQTVDPDPQYPAAMDSDAGHAAKAIERYRKGEVKQPDTIRTTDVGVSK